MSKVIPGGNFSVARKIYDSKIWMKPPLYLKVWIYLLGHANNSDQEKNGRTYKRGEIITTYDKIMKGIAYYENRRTVIPSLKKIRIVLDWLQSENMIHVTPLKIERPTGADTGARTWAYIGIQIAIINYDTYQTDSNYKGRHKGRPFSQQGHNNNNGEECINKYCAEVLSYLNEKTGRKYSKAPHLKARLKDGATVENCRKVIDAKTADPYFIENPRYLNPDTLFRPGNFDKYLNETIPPKTERRPVNGSSCPKCSRQIPAQDRTAGGCVHCERKAEAR